ncbi:MAG: hypothetical protein EXR01_00795 [Acetobacteraceae bacterium]|nr:hypothetical protein [Acetobacteraceae bacterium]
MSLSRRGFLFALGLALPAVTLTGGEVEAVEGRPRTRRSKPTQAHTNPKHAKSTKPKKHVQRRRRRHIAA